ncbi:MAG TPA: hypothetical protein VD999_02760 [Vitreimonas sp.]|nr:hypothetical protein [Vitreimonas sp.]
MPDKFELVLLQYTLSNLNELIINFNKVLINEFQVLFGEIKKVQIIDKTSNKTWKTNYPILEIISPKFEWHLIFENQNSVDFYFDKQAEKISLFLEIKESKNVSLSLMINLIKKLTSIFDFTNLSVENLTKSPQVWQQLSKINPTLYNPINFFFVGGTKWLQIYPRKEIRDGFYLPLPDDFYLSIPADHIEKVNNESILVCKNNDPFASVDEQVEKTKKIVDYYFQNLSELELWGEVKWSPNWRKDYQHFLLSKGYEI